MELEQFVWYCDSCMERKPVNYDLTTDNYHCDECANEATPEQRVWDNAVRGLIDALSKVEQLLSLRDVIDEKSYEEADELREHLVDFARHNRPKGA